VATLRNFRPLCINGLLYRDGAVCTLCPTGSGGPACGTRATDSKVASLPLTLANRAGPGHDPLLAEADRLIVLSDLAAEVTRGPAWRRSA
jgi:hypothetical protein